MALIVVLGALPSWARERIDLRRVVVDLPALPASIVPADLDGDGRTDLVVVTDFAEVGEIGEDRFEGRMQVSTVVPALFDRREVRGWLATETGGYRATEALDLPRSAHSLEAGPPGWPALAVTDDGLSVLRVGDDGGLSLEPVVERRTALAGTEVFLPALRTVADLDGDGDRDVLLPTREGLVALIDPAAGGASFVVAGTAPELAPNGRSRRYPWPRLARVDADDRPDLVVFDRGSGWSAERIRVLLGDERGGFRPLRAGRLDCHDRGELRFAGDVDGPPWPSDPMALRDLDGDGRAELVRRRFIERPGDGLRAGLKEARRPRFELSFHRVTTGGEVAPEPYAVTEIEGHLLENAGPFTLDPFVDLDGDGREELVAVTLRFSMMQAVRVVVTKKISVGIDFHIWRQDDEGRFRPVEGLDLSEKLKLDLRDLELRRFAHFNGDFDGDGLRDFAHLGRGRTVTIHRGVAGCRYPDEPDLTIELEREPERLEHARVEDLDGDGRSDLAVVQQLPRDDPDESPPARLELYLSGGAR